MAQRQAVKAKRTIIVFQADQDVKSLISKGIAKKIGRNGNPRGLIKKFCNEALRLYFRELAGKREAQT
jgi:hypothetical protein